MSDPREDDEPVSIEAEVPEADWIEQHQPASDEDDADVYATGAREDDDDVSIESDTPEADWIEQHQPIVEAPDAEFLPSDDLPEEVEDAGEVEQDWIATDEEVGAANGDGDPDAAQRLPEVVAATSSPPSRTPCWAPGATPPDSSTDATDARRIEVAAHDPAYAGGGRSGRTPASAASWLV